MPAFRVRAGFGARLFPAGLVAVLAGFGLYFDHIDAASRKETDMTIMASSKSPQTSYAKHGPRSEVTWEGGSGRQPYANQGEQETTESDNHEVAEGNRGAQSGRNREQLDKARGTP